MEILGRPFRLIAVSIRRERRSFISLAGFTAPVGEPTPCRRTKRNVHGIQSTQRNKISGGETGIRTLVWLPITRFPSVRLQPLGHLSHKKAYRINIESPGLQILAEEFGVEAADGFVGLGGWDDAADFDFRR